MLQCVLFSLSDSEWFTYWESSSAESTKGDKKKLCLPTEVSYSPNGALIHPKGTPRKTRVKHWTRVEFYVRHNCKPCHASCSFSGVFWFPFWVDYIHLAWIKPFSWIFHFQQSLITSDVRTSSPTRNIKFMYQWKSHTGNATRSATRISVAEINSTTALQPRHCCSFL